MRSSRVLQQSGRQIYRILAAQRYRYHDLSRASVVGTAAENSPEFKVRVLSQFLLDYPIQIFIDFCSFIHSLDMVTMSANIFLHDAIITTVTIYPTVTPPPPHPHRQPGNP